MTDLDAKCAAFLWPNLVCGYDRPISKSWRWAGEALAVLSERGLYVYTCTYHAVGGPHYTRVTIRKEAESDFNEDLEDEPLACAGDPEGPMAIAKAIAQLADTNDEPI